MRQKDIFLDSNIRKKQVVNWLEETIQKKGYSLNRVIQLAENGKNEESLREFTELIDNTRQYLDTAINYPIGDTIDKYGKHRVMRELYFEMVIRKYRIRRTKTEIKDVRVKKATLEETKKHRNIIYGLNEKGEEERASLNAYISKGKIIYKAKSLKTGRFLKQTDTINKRIEELKKL